MVLASFQLSLVVTTILFMLCFDTGCRQWGIVSISSTTLAINHCCCRGYDWRNWSIGWKLYSKCNGHIQTKHRFICMGLFSLCNSRCCSICCIKNCPRKWTKSWVEKGGKARIQQTAASRDIIIHRPGLTAMPPQHTNGFRAPTIIYPVGNSALADKAG